MNWYLNKRDHPEYKIRFKILLSDFLLNLDQYGKKLSFEYDNPSLMNGISGVGLALLQIMARQ